ncbi:MAG: sulfotransferase family 2 domain-containing protein [Pseudomonadota bacterium]
MVVVLRSHKIAYFPIPKVANTSIKLGLQAAVPEQDFMNIGNKRMSATAREAAMGCYKVAVVREPLSRMLSAYGNRVMDERDIDRSRATKFLLRILGRSAAPDINEFFLNLPTYMRTNDRIRRHLMLQKQYLGTDLGYFDRIYRLDEIDVLAQDLSRRIGTTVTFGRHQTSGPKYRADDLSAAAQSAVLHYLEPDYRLLSAYFPLPQLAQPARSYSTSNL